MQSVSVTGCSAIDGELSNAWQPVSVRIWPRQLQTIEREQLAACKTLATFIYSRAPLNEARTTVRDRPPAVSAAPPYMVSGRHAQKRHALLHRASDATISTCCVLSTSVATWRQPPSQARREKIQSVRPDDAAMLALPEPPLLASPYLEPLFVHGSGKKTVTSSKHGSGSTCVQEGDGAMRQILMLGVRLDGQRPPPRPAMHFHAQVVCMRPSRRHAGETLGQAKPNIRARTGHFRRGPRGSTLVPGHVHAVARPQIAERRLLRRGTGPALAETSAAPSGRPSRIADCGRDYNEDAPHSSFSTVATTIFQSTGRSGSRPDPDGDDGG